MGKADVVLGEIPYFLFEGGKKVGVNPDYPHHGRCKSGHTVIDVGPHVRFFSISGPAVPLEVEGIYCLKCLTIANLLAKKKQASTIDPEKLARLADQA